MGIWDAVWALLTVGVLSRAYTWVSSKNRKIMAMGIALIAVAWAFFRSVTHAQAVLIRPLGGVWWIILILVAVGVLALVVFKWSKLAKWIAWVSLALAVFLPFDFGNAWNAWLTSPSFSMWAGVVTIFVTGLFLWMIAKTRVAAGITLLLALAMLIAALQFATTGTAGPAQTVPTVSALPTSSAGVTPSASPSAAATSATPSPSPSPTEAETTNAVKELSASEGSVITWQHVTTLVNEQDATWFSQLIDNNQSKLGFNWDNVKDWGKARMSNGNAVGARVIVVFGADKSDIGDGAARKLVNITSKKVSIVRATGCFTAVADNKEICPSGDQQVVVFLAPVVKDGSTIGLRTESGVALVPSSDGKVVLTPATYVAK